MITYDSSGFPFWPKAKLDLLVSVVDLRWSRDGDPSCFSGPRLPVISPQSYSFPRWPSDSVPSSPQPWPLIACSSTIRENPRPLLSLWKARALIASVLALLTSLSTPPPGSWLLHWGRNVRDVKSLETGTWAVQSLDQDAKPKQAQPEPFSLPCWMLGLFYLMSCALWYAALFCGGSPCCSIVQSLLLHFILCVDVFGWCILSQKCINLGISFSKSHIWTALLMIHSAVGLLTC